jgi:chromosome segregation ATPase
MNNFTDVKNVLNNLKANYLAKLQSKLNDNNYTQSHLSSSVNNLTKHLKDLNKEYNKSKENNISIMNQSVKLNGDLKRLLLQNKGVGNVIKKDRNECEVMRKQINELDKGKLLIENQCEVLHVEIAEMKKQSKLLPNLINKCEEDRKNLMTAILIVKKKSDEIKREIFKMNNNKDFMNQDLRSIVSYYKNAQV